MKLTVRILRTDKTITEQTIATKKRRIDRALVEIGSRLRITDPTICAIRTNKLKLWSWVGASTEEHTRVLNEVMEQKQNW